MHSLNQMNVQFTMSFCSTGEFRWQNDGVNHINRIIFFEWNDTHMHRKKRERERTAHEICSRFVISINFISMFQLQAAMVVFVFFFVSFFWYATDKSRRTTYDACHGKMWSENVYFIFHVQSRATIVFRIVCARSFTIERQADTASHRKRTIERSYSLVHLRHV